MLYRSASQINSMKVPTQKNLFKTSCSNLTKDKKQSKKKKKHKRIQSSGQQFLAPLVGKNVIKAPKIFENQIFSDVYDEKGNHDRVLSTPLDKSKDMDVEFVTAELLNLPSAGRHVFNKRIRFY